MHPITGASQVLQTEEKAQYYNYEANFCIFSKA